MDYHYVESKFRLTALVFEVVLALLLICYMVYAVMLIVEEDPPVETSSTRWKSDLGVWALCSDNPTELAGVGTGSLRFGREVFSSEDNTAAVEGVSVSPPQMMVMSDSIGEQNCSIMDLTNVQIEVPFYFNICNDGGDRSSYHLQIDHKWVYVTHSPAGHHKWFSIRRSDHGWNYGYSSAVESTFAADSIDGPWSGGDRTYKCAAGMTWFQSARGETSVLSLAVVEPFVVTYLEQGFLPQLFGLLSTVGGYITILIIFYKGVFVKQYPYSPVSKIYDARTLICKRYCCKCSSSPPTRDESTQTNSPAPNLLPPTNQGRCC
eukprot:Skav200791  [mRNA]  locus=scaffold318:111437:112396:- [translate_table: standard]